MIVLKCEGEILFVAGNSYLKEKIIPTTENENIVTGILQIYCNTFTKNLVYIENYNKNEVVLLIENCMALFYGYVKKQYLLGKSDNIVIDMVKLINKATELAEKGEKVNEVD